MLRDDKGARHSADSPARNCGQGRGMPSSPNVPDWVLSRIDCFTLPLESAGRSPLTVARYTDAIGSSRVRSDSQPFGSASGVEAP